MAKKSCISVSVSVFVERWAGKEVLDDMHRRKIDMGDAIFVVNVGRYIGESTRAEFEYARRNGREIRWLEEPEV